MTITGVWRDYSIEATVNVHMLYSRFFSRSTRLLWYVRKLNLSLFFATFFWLGFDFADCDLP